MLSYQNKLACHVDFLKLSVHVFASNGMKLCEHSLKERSPPTMVARQRNGKFQLLPHNCYPLYIRWLVCEYTFVTRLETDVTARQLSVASFLFRGSHRHECELTVAALWGNQSRKMYFWWRTRRDFECRTSTTKNYTNQCSYGTFIVLSHAIQYILKRRIQKFFSTSIGQNLKNFKKFKIYGRIATKISYLVTPFYWWPADQRTLQSRSCRKINEENISGNK